MWTRAELKDRAKMCLSRYYWAAFLVSLIFAILSGFGGSNANTQRITSYLEQTINPSVSGQAAANDRGTDVKKSEGGPGRGYYLNGKFYSYTDDEKSEQ